MNQWKYVKNNISEVELKKAEDVAKIQFSQQFKEIVLKYNNGRPSKKLFDTNRSRGRIFEKLLSFNASDIENVFKTNESLKGQLPDDMFAIAVDPFGNYVCIDKVQKAFFWLHETAEVEATGLCIQDLIDALY